MRLDDVVDSATIVVLTMYCNRERDSPQFRDTYRLGCSLARCHDLHEWNYSIRKWSSDWSLAQFWSCSCHNWVQYSNAFCKRVHLEHGQRGLSGLWDVYRWFAYPDWTPENDIHLKKKFIYKLMILAILICCVKLLSKSTKIMHKLVLWSLN